MKHDNGFTLIELIITILITGILSGVFVNLFSLGARTFCLVEKGQEANQNKRIVLERMGREIRNSLKLAISSSTDLVLVADIDDDGKYEEVRYLISGGDLYKTIDNTEKFVVLENAKIDFTGDSNRVVIYLSVSSDGAASSIRACFTRRQSLS